MDNSIKDLSVGEKFKAHIETTGFTLEFIAIQLNISRSHLSRILNNKREISKNLQNKLNAFLNTDFSL